MIEEFDLGGEKNTVTLTLQEYETLSRKAWLFDVLKKEKLENDRYLDDFEKVIFKASERGTENAVEHK